MSTWLERTGQGTRFRAGLAFSTVVLLPTLIVALCYTTLESVVGVDGVPLLMIGSVFLGIAGFTVLARSVRCPRCGTRAVWRVLRTAPSGRWLQAVLVLQACPECGDSAEVPRESPARREGQR